MSRFLWLAIWVPAAVLAWAAIAKLMSLDSVRSYVINSLVVPGPLVGIVPFAVIILELGTAIALMIPGAPRRIAALTATVLFSIFAGFSVWRIIGGVKAPCPCLGTVVAMTPVTSFLLCVALGIASSLCYGLSVVRS